jgi:hypothetical protein
MDPQPEADGTERITEQRFFTRFFDVERLGIIFCPEADFRTWPVNLPASIMTCKLLIHSDLAAICRALLLRKQLCSP